MLYPRHGEKLVLPGIVAPALAPAAISLMRAVVDYDAVYVSHAIRAENGRDSAWFDASALLTLHISTRRICGMKSGSQCKEIKQSQ